MIINGVSETMSEDVVVACFSGKILAVSWKYRGTAGKPQIRMVGTQGGI
jgi:hypothetical protein